MLLIGYLSSFKGGLESRLKVDTSVRGHESRFFYEIDIYRYNASLAVMIELKGFERTSNSAIGCQSFGEPDRLSSEAILTRLYANLRNRIHVPTNVGNRGSE